MDKAQAPKKKKKSGAVTKFLVFSLIIMFILTAGGIALLYWTGTKAVEEAPLQPQVMAFTSEDFNTAYRKIQPIGSAVMQSHPDQVCQLVLSSAEVNSLLGLVNNSGMLSAVSGSNFSLPKNSNLRMENNWFWFSGYRVIDQKNPFGKYINFQVAVEPDIRDGKINYRFAVCKIGQLEVPSFVLQKYLDMEAGTYNESSDTLKKAIIDFYVDRQGFLHLKFYPFQLRQILINNMKKNQDQSEKN